MALTSSGSSLAASGARRFLKALPGQSGVGNTDTAWEYFGRENPYFGVLTRDRFSRERLDGDGRADFFASGEDYIATMFETTRRQLLPDFRPSRALDFGCGVGRLAMPLARRCQEVVGVDISDSMLAEAAANSSEAGLSNIELVKSDDELTQVNGTFDLVHSFIVFQHIPHKRGEVILRALIDRLRAGGVGILHFTYANSTSTPLSRRALTAAYVRFPGLHGLRNLAKHESAAQPHMQMNRYDLNRLLRVLQETGCHRVHVRFTEASYYGFPLYGVILYFSKHRLDVGAYA
jgi:2-polyprenyl-3-methyl-5-hydroxy-6-metoxy-1,4-benzoquinol methylase